MENSLPLMLTVLAPKLIFHVMLATNSEEIVYRSVFHHYNGLFKSQPVSSSL